MQLILIAIFLPVLAVPLLIYTSRALKNNLAWVAFACAVISALSVVIAGISAGWHGPLVLHLPWISHLGIHFSFLIDGVSLFFALIVTVMGALVCFYARFYLVETPLETGRFYSYLMLFMSAMLGTVFSNNLILLFLFWELTGIASFFLIGFFYEEEASRRGALMALIVTAGAGLVMLAGFILLGAFAGTYDVLEIISQKETAFVFQSGLLIPLLLIMIGAFAKSAQFPFHFWLPNAMAAPTPVSAYLHSAAMVKLGIFLTARLYPVLVESPLWMPLLVTIGFLTMTLGAVLALLSNDIKALLAYTTVSQLGFLIGVYGLGTEQGVTQDFFHILNHVFYKGSLFMVAGIIIHSMGIKDIRKMGGLFKVMPLTAISCILAGAAMAGIPGTTGFISKELMVASIFDFFAIYKVAGIVLLLALGISAACLIATGLRLIIKLFFGTLPSDEAHAPHTPSLWFQLPPFILAACTLLFGLLPGLLGDFLHTMFVTGLHDGEGAHLAIWHGFTKELFFSLTVIIIGVGLFVFGNARQWAFTRIPAVLQFDDYYDKTMNGITTIAVKLTALVRTDRPSSYFPIILGFIGAALFLSLLSVSNRLPGLFQPDTISWLEAVTALIIGAFALAVILTKHWVAKLIALSVTGFLVSFYFMLYQAPDLALTQMMIEAVSLVLILLLLGRLPKIMEARELKKPVRLSVAAFKIGLSALVGLIMATLIMLITITAHPAPVGDYVKEHTVPLAEGANAVNTILVDFRGFDTMGEISVLVISMLGILGLLMKRQQLLKNQPKRLTGKKETD